MTGFQLLALNPRYTPTIDTKKKPMPLYVDKCSRANRSRF